MVAIARPLAGSNGRHGELVAALHRLYAERLRGEGSLLEAGEMKRLLGPDVELNAQGLCVWLDREARAALAS